MKGLFPIVCILSLFSTSISSAAGAQPITLFFEGEGLEQGITVPGACCFSVGGATLGSAPGVTVPSDPALTASGVHAYAVQGTDIGGLVTFDPPVEALSFFFVHAPAGGGIAVVIGESGASVSLASAPATTPGDPANFVHADLHEPIDEIVFFALGEVVIDDLTFTPVATSVPASALPTRVLLTFLLIGSAAASIDRRLDRRSWRRLGARRRSGLPATTSATPGVVPARDDFAPS